MMFMFLSKEQESKLNMSKTDPKMSKLRKKIQNKSQIQTKKTNKRNK